MNSWNIISSPDDINNLLESYGGFHDSCLVSVSYRSGTHVTNENAMSFGPSNAFELYMTFHSQWYKKPLELFFTGVRRCSIVGFQNNYFSEILDCYLTYHTDLFAGRDEQLIVWADFAGFSPSSESHEKVLHEPATTYVIAEQLKWRFVS